ncbi:MAG TPA: hypothetical protein VL128_00330 [Candidatus Eisenbacteria bacterium]|nr:hypothetical protein [Candidatus Eisenbacteria bacterium]
MLRRSPIRSLACWMVAFAAAIPPIAAQPKHEKNVWNYDGGVFLETDGAIPGGACLRLMGRLYASEFFNNLKREDTTSGTLFRRGNDIVTDFPKQMQLTIAIFDMPCDPMLQQTGAHVYLTDEMLRSLRLSFYWKRELVMRPVRGIVVRNFTVSPIPQVFEGESDKPPQRYEWRLTFDVPSDGVPVTDSLVLILRTSDHRIVARTAARL